MMNGNTRHHRAAARIPVIAGAAALSIGFAVVAQASRPARASLPAMVHALSVSPAYASELARRPALVERLRQTPHNYFRFVNGQFSTAVCGLFDESRTELPDVNLHGDVHVEQYAVTSLGRGLTDFDAAARGPSVIDLVRFGVSLELTARQKGWPGEGSRAFDEFLRGYRSALQEPRLRRSPGPVIRRLEERFAHDHSLALRRADAQMEADPVPAVELNADFQRYAAEVRGQSPGLPAAFFLIKKAGRLRTGIGSALDEKYLVRVEGRTADERDDEILEAKLVGPLPETDCVHAEVGPQRVPLGMELIAEYSFPFSGLLVRGGRTFWVHGWTDDYVELSIDSSLRRPPELREVALEVGMQLGRAHPREAPGNEGTALRRRTLLAWTRHNEGRIRDAIHDLTAATVTAWGAFRAEAGRPQAAGRDATTRCSWRG